MDKSMAVVVIGAGATALVDLWAIVRRRVFGVPAPDYSLVGRWFAHMARGRFRHAAIAASASVPRERAIGWVAHYATGVVFAALLVAIAGEGWIPAPTFLPALAVGAATVVAPFLIMQPAMGAGIAASRTRHPAAARFHSVVTHLVFGAGLYLAAWLTSTALR